MKTLAITLLLAVASIEASAQITSAEDRMRRQANNSRQAIDVTQVVANRFDLGDKPFLLIIHWSVTSKLKQIEANRWEARIESADGRGSIIAHFPRGGAAAINSIKSGDVVIARVKPDAGEVVEILGVSAVNVWE